MEMTHYPNWGKRRGHKMAKLITGDPPEILYHYTTPKALSEILKTKKLWATDFHYLNDYTELLLAIELTRTRIEGQNPKLKFEWIGPDFIAKTRFNVGVFSLSSEKDLLSQWRSYCPPTGGYAIGFDYRQLDSLLKNRKFLGLKRCIYDENEQKQMIDEYIEEIRPPGRAMDVQKFIQQVGLLIKDNRFEEEHEWRAVSEIIAPLFNPTNAKRGIKWDVREGNHHLVPYLEIDLKDNLVAFPIREIRVGPC